MLTLVIGLHARELHDVAVPGFPFVLYVGAQALLVLYVAIIGFHAWYMNKLDRIYAVQEAEEQ